MKLYASNKLNERLASLCEEEKCLTSFGDLEGDILKKDRCKLGRYEKKYLSTLNKIRAEIKKIRSRLTLERGGDERVED